jgi:sodium transport system permease protein
METTLTLFATRTELVLGKYCAVVTANLIVAAIVLFFLLISLLSAALVSSTPVTWSGFSLIGFKAGLSYLTSVTYFAIVYPAILMLIGLFARSMKEAFSYLGPIMLLSILSTIAPLYGIGLSPLTLLVPGLNCLLLVQQYFNSSVDWMDWMILFCTGIVYAFACLKGAIFLIKRDAVLNRT